MKKNSASPPETVVIKKYENRRLYDTARSCYVNLEEVARMLQGGKNVRVVDAATGEDITRLILTQIIVDDAKGPDSNFPIDILRDMVIASGRASQESALKYMKTMLELYQTTYRVIAPAVSPFSVAAKRQEEAAAEAGEAPVDVVALKDKVAELEAMVAGLAGKKPAGKKGAGKRG